MAAPGFAPTSVWFPEPVAPLPRPEQQWTPERGPPPGRGQNGPWGGPAGPRTSRFTVQLMRLSLLSSVITAR